jgi:hypothetical protein
MRDPMFFMNISSFPCIVNLGPLLKQVDVQGRICLLGIRSQ